MKLILEVPVSYTKERSYTYEVILSKFLGLEYELELCERNVTTIRMQEDSPKKLILSDILFQTPEEKWLKEESLPYQPLKVWNIGHTAINVKLIDKRIPIIYGKDPDQSEFIQTSENCISLGLDIFGSAFFMFTRYEELVKPDSDQHDRFPATASLAYQEGFLDRPIINEYVEILWWCLKKLWPGLTRKKRFSKILLSHDVDVPFGQAFQRLPQLIKSCGGDIIKRRNLAMAFRRTESWFAVKQGALNRDSNYTFDQIMDISERNNLKSSFYFKTACTDNKFDDHHSIDHPLMRNLLKTIYDRGHEIGFHASYNTYQDPEQTKKEFKYLKEVCQKQGIQQSEWGGRQHYLRWQMPITWQNWEDAGLDYDSTLTYADCAGFRCGTCYEYPVFNLSLRKTLKLRERPLIVMEGSILGEQYMNLIGKGALERILQYKERCSKFSGEFTLLWHNSSFNYNWQWEMYKQIVGGK